MYGIHQGFLSDFSKQTGTPENRHYTACRICLQSVFLGAIALVRKRLQPIRKLILIHGQLSFSVEFAGKGVRFKFFSARFQTCDRIVASQWIACKVMI
jgi:hypothetical protein